MILGFAACLGACADPAAPADAGADAAVAATERVDILVVVQNPHGNEATEENAIEIGIAIDLASSLHDDSARNSVRVAFVSSDMGVGAVSDAGPGCDSALGDDGIAVGLPGGPQVASTCDLPADGWFQVDTDAQRDAFVATRGSCNVQVSSCFWSQPLEAGLKALSPSDATSWSASGYIPPIFRDGTLGHGAEDGFLRPDSVLVMLFDAPIDDCSTGDTSIFSYGEARYADVPLSMRCHMTPDARYPVERYVQGFLGLRRSPHRLVLGVFAGMPLEDAYLSPSEVLADPAMVEVFSGEPPSVEPNCSGPNGIGVSEPGRRFVSVAAGVVAAGGHVALGSSCDGDRRDLERRLHDAVRTAMQASP